MQKVDYRGANPSVHKLVLELMTQSLQMFAVFYDVEMWLISFKGNNKYSLFSQEDVLNIKVKGLQDDYNCSLTYCANMHCTSFQSGFRLTIPNKKQQQTPKVPVMNYAFLPTQCFGAWFCLISAESSLSIRCLIALSTSSVLSGFVLNWFIAYFPWWFYCVAINSFSNFSICGAAYEISCVWSLTTFKIYFQGEIPKPFVSCQKHFGARAQCGGHLNSCKDESVAMDFSSTLCQPHPMVFRGALLHKLFVPRGLSHPCFGSVIALCCVGN